MSNPKLSSHDQRLYKLPKPVPSIKPRKARKPVNGQMKLVAENQEFSRKT